MTLEMKRPGAVTPDAPETHSGGEPSGDDGGSGAGRRRGRGAGRGRGRKRRSRTFGWTVAVLAGLLAIVVLTPLTVGFRVWYQARQDERPKSDAIVVLGAAQYNGRPSPTLEWRLRHARALYQKGVAPVIVTVGGKQPGDRVTEAQAGRTWLVGRAGVPAARVVAVAEGGDTLESMRAVGREFERRGWRSAVIVSDPWHGLRSKKMAEDQGISAAASPTRSGPSVQTRDTQFHYIVRETGAYLSYVLLGRSVQAPGDTGMNAETVP